MYTTILALNAVAALLSALGALLALLRPEIFSRSSHVEHGERFYAKMYAARSIPFGLAAAVFPL